MSSLPMNGLVSFSQPSQHLYSCLQPASWQIPAVRVLLMLTRLACAQQGNELMHRVLWAPTAWLAAPQPLSLLCQRPLAGP